MASTTTTAAALIRNEQIRSVDIAEFENRWDLLDPATG
jgi:hypothetical protein